MIRKQQNISKSIPKMQFSTYPISQNNMHNVSIPKNLATKKLPPPVPPVLPAIPTTRLIKYDNDYDNVHVNDQVNDGQDSDRFT